MIFSTLHPEGLFCPICGCGSIVYWPELSEWDTWDDEKKASYETCAACNDCVSKLNEGG